MDAASLYDYVAKAVALAEPSAARAARRRIADRHAALLGDLKPVRALERFLEKAVMAAIEGVPPPADWTAGLPKAASVA
jgi:hypothetical protein